MYAEAMTVTIEPLNVDNWYSVCQLSVSEEQKEWFPIPNVYWIGISRYEEKTELYAIRKDDEYVGLVGCGYDEDGISGYINPLMVDQKYQRQGTATKAMRLVIRYLEDNLHVACIHLGHRKENSIAARLYERLGFEAAEETDLDCLRTLHRIPERTNGKGETK